MAGTLLSNQARRCVDALSDCVEACEVCAQHCIRAADESMVECIRLCLDSVTFAQACLVTVPRGSRWAPELCGMCANVVDACADECARFDDEVMLACAEACRRAAEACRQMAASAA